MKREDKPYAKLVRISGTMNSDEVETIVGFCERLIVNGGHAVLVAPDEVQGLLASAVSLKRLLQDNDVLNH
jgi:hypothetical protein